MKFNQELIQKLRNGEIAIDKQQNIERVKAVLKEAFPEDNAEPHTDLIERCKFGRNNDDVITWIQYYNREQEFTSLPTHQVEDFIEVELKEQKQYMVIIKKNNQLYDSYTHGCPYYEALEIANEAIKELAYKFNVNETATAEIVSIEKTLTATKTITIS